MATDWHLIGRVRNSKYRERTLLSLNGKRTPADLQRDLRDVSLQHVSRALRELKHFGFVECLTPNVYSYRLYQRTKKGNQIARTIERLTRS